MGPIHIMEVTPNNNKHHIQLFKILGNVLPRTPSAAAPTSGIRPVTSPGRCNGVTAPTAAAAGPPSPAKFAAEETSRAKPPERMREERDNWRL